jgi:hypothetical protein
MNVARDSVLPLLNNVVGSELGAASLSFAKTGSSFILAKSFC